LDDLAVRLDELVRSLHEQESVEATLRGIVPVAVGAELGVRSTLSFQLYLKHDNSTT
jgi:hypothetical protein